MDVLEPLDILIMNMKDRIKQLEHKADIDNQVSMARIVEDKTILDELLKIQEQRNKKRESEP